MQTSIKVALFGQIDLVTFEAGNVLDINKAGGLIWSLDRKEALELRDAILKLYPLPEAPEQRYTVEEIKFPLSETYNVVERTTRLVANAYDRPTAEKIAAALNAAG